MSKVKIGLDAGHYLYSQGKQTPDGIKEWTLNDKVRDKVVAILADYDCEIIHVDGNEGKIDEELTDRLNSYMRAGCEAFVSIHHNAYTGTWNNATGVEIFTDKNPTAKDIKLAECIYSRLVKYTGMVGRGIKKEAFLVINQNSIPAVLVEGGFMDGREDYKYIISDKGQTAYAKAVAEGLIEFLSLKKKTTTSATTTPATTKVLYRVRKTWKDSASQLGAFASLTNAKKLANSLPGYKVFDNNGKVVYTPKTKTTTTKAVTEDCKVKVKKGAKDYNGDSVASFVYDKVYTVDELDGKRAVLDLKGICTAFHVDNLIVQ